MNKKQGKKEQKSPFNFQLTFQLYIYLQQLKAISIPSQGQYFIAIAVFPKNQNSQHTFQTTQTFKIKYTSQIQPIGQCFPFCFSLQQNLAQKQTPKNKNNAFHKIVISFEIMKKSEEDFSLNRTSDCIQEEYLRLGFVSMQLDVTRQTLFSEFLNINFNYPCAAQLTGAVFCQLKSMQQVCQSEILTFIKRLEEQKEEKKEILRQQYQQFRKSVKKYIFSSFMVRKEMQVAFTNKKQLTVKKELEKRWEELKQKEERDTLRKQFLIMKTSETKIQLQICNDIRLEETQITAQLVRYELNEISILEMLKDIEKLCTQNKKLYQKMLKLFKQNNTINIEWLRQKQETNRLIFYTQKIKTFAPQQFFSLTHQKNCNAILYKSLNQAQSFLSQSPTVRMSEPSILQTELKTCRCSEQEMKEFKKDVEKLKKKEKYFFTPLQSYFNLTPSALESRFDCCPFIYHSGITNPLANPQEGQREEGKVKNIFVFAHGYQAKSQNMETLKNSFKKIFKNSKFLILDSLGGKTDRDIKELGKKAACQIDQYITTQHRKNNRPYRIIMVGHSMGGIILRAALPHISKGTTLLLHTFISFATPHLGYLNCQSLITKAGIKVINYLASSASLQQLTNQDSPFLKDTFIYELSKSCSLTSFKHILLFSSLEDKYVPWNSARIQISRHQNSKVEWCSSKSLHRSIEEEMINNIFGSQLKRGQNKILSVDRLEVDFNVNKLRIDNLIGRTAHVEFLINQHIVPMAMLCCLKNTLYSSLQQQ